MFDGQVVRPPQKFREAAASYVCVRIVNINEVDLAVYPFDFDLTMAILLANADGTVYHRYGGRTHLSPMSMDSLVEIMGEGLKTHGAYLRNPRPPDPRPPLYLPELVSAKLKGFMKPGSGCFHCHYAREAQQLLRLKGGKWTPDQFWIFPLPKQIGIVVDQRSQSLVKRVLPRSPAEIAGIRPGDRLRTLAGQRILAKYDIQWVLNESDGGECELPFSAEREGKRIDGRLLLKPGWKVGDPEDYAWRVANPFTAHMIKFLPTPGFIGERLSPVDLGALGLSKKRFAPRVTELEPVAIELGEETAWVHEGKIELKQGIRVTDPQVFHMLVEIDAQVCDDRRCHKFRAVLETHAPMDHFIEYQGDPDREPRLSKFD